MSSTNGGIFGSSKYLGIFQDVFQNAGHYFAARRIIRQCEAMSPDDIRNYQFHRLREIITTAYEHIPFYKEHFRIAGFRPEHFRQIEDIRHIPYLTKDMIRESYRKMFMPQVPLRLFKLMPTGGSTGVPLNLYLDRRTSTPYELAYLQHIWKRLGYNFLDRCVVLRGDVFEDKKGSDQYWKMNYPINWLIMSSFRLNDQIFPAYIDKIRKFRPRFIIAYPSVAYILAHYINSNSLPLIESLQGIICSSETLYDWQRKYIQETLKVKVCAYYGLTEKCCLAAQFVDSDGYEFIPTYGFVELINTSNQWCTQGGETGEVIATGLSSLTAPLIRYQTQDLCVYSEKSGRIHDGWPIVDKITGRNSEFVITSDGSTRTFTCSHKLIWTVMHKIDAYQFVQKVPGVLQLRLELRETLTEEDQKNLRHAFYDYYPGFEAELNFTDKIHRTKSGKFQYLIQHLKNDFRTDAQNPVVH